MTADQLAGLCSGKRIGRGKWVGLCPAHGDRQRSLAISVGKKTPVVLRCMSQGCSTEDILKAMGLTWQDILGERAVTPAVRERIRDQENLEKMEHRFGLIIMAKVLDPQRRLYWISAEAGIERDIWTLKRKLAEAK